MGRGRGKGKKLAVTTHEDPGSDGEESPLVHKRRGRPQKPLKDDIDEEEETEKVEDEDGENSKSVIKKEMKGPVSTENGKKRKRYSQIKENTDSVNENSVGTRSSTENSTKSNGFRQNGSRRKSKPRRAAEAGVVECK